jgi:hypothetical protein
MSKKRAQPVLPRTTQPAEAHKKKQQIKEDIRQAWYRN